VPVRRARPGDRGAHDLRGLVEQIGVAGLLEQRRQHAGEVDVRVEIHTGVDPLASGDTRLLERAVGYQPTQSDVPHARPPDPTMHHSTEATHRESTTAETSSH